MEYAKNEGADWRYMLEEWIESHLHHSVFNPNRESEKFLRRALPNEDLRALKQTDIARYTSVVRRLVDLDSKEIATKSDYIVCYWDRSAARGAGTKGELTVARLFGKPVFMVTRIKQESIAGWVLGCASNIFRSFDELKLFLLDRYAD